MENKTANDQQPLTQDQAADKIEQAFMTMGEAMFSIAQEQQDIRCTLSQMMQDRLELVELGTKLSEHTRNISDNQDAAVDAIKAMSGAMQAMNTRIDLLTTLLDAHHKALAKVGIVPSPGMVDQLSN